MDSLAAEGENLVYGTAWSLVPFFVVIPLSLLTRQVLPGLLVGLVVGSYMVHPSLLGGVDGTLSYLLKELLIADNLRLILFLYGFGAFVGLIRVTGGVQGFAQWVERHVHTVRGAFILTWLSSAATFMAPDFRIITIAPVIRHIFKKLGVPAAKVAFVIDVTATPLCALVPVGTAFVGYMVGLLGATQRHHGTGGDATAYHLFLRSIPFNLFAIGMILFGLLRTFVPGKSLPTQRPTPPKRPTQQARRVASVQMASWSPLHAVDVEMAESLTPDARILRRAAGASRRVVPDSPSNPSSDPEEGFPDPVEMVAASIRPHAPNLMVPLALLLGLTLFLTWWDGHAQSPTLLGALTHANAAKAMLEALLITLFVSLGWFAVQRQPVGRTMFGFLAGGNEMMGVITLLVLVWAVSAVSSDLGFSAFVGRSIGGWVPPSLIAPVLFIIGCAISYVIGSSFGTWGMLMPLAFTLAAGAHASLPLIAGAVFASGTFGGFASPLSDNTVAMATVMKLPLMEYARVKLMPALLVAGASAALYAVFGWLLPATA